MPVDKFKLSFIINGLLCIIVCLNRCNIQGEAVYDLWIKSRSAVVHRSFTSSCQSPQQIAVIVIYTLFALPQRRYTAAPMKHRCMITAAKSVTNFWQAVIR